MNGVEASSHYNPHSISQPTSHQEQPHANNQGAGVDEGERDMICHNGEVCRGKLIEAENDADDEDEPNVHPEISGRPLVIDTTVVDTTAEDALRHSSDTGHEELETSKPAELEDGEIEDEPINTSSTSHGGRDESPSAKNTPRQAARAPRNN